MMKTMFGFPASVFKGPRKNIERNAIGNPILLIPVVVHIRGYLVLVECSYGIERSFMENDDVRLFRRRQEELIRNRE